MELDLYDKDVVCPVCTSRFKTKKLKSSKVKVEKLHPDFYTEYRGENPNHYSVHVCPMCGYSAFESDFDKITEQDKVKIRNKITVMWKSQDFGSARSCAEAIQTFKLAFLCYNVIPHKMSMMAKIALRLMWLYRECGDQVNEQKYMQAAADYFCKAYEMDHQSEDTQSENYQVLFMAAELNRQLGNLNEAVRWFSMLLKEPDLKKKARHLDAKARDLMMEAADEYRKRGGEITENLE